MAENANFQIHSNIKSLHQFISWYHYDIPMLQPFDTWSLGPWGLFQRGETSSWRPAPQWPWWIWPSAMSFCAWFGGRCFKRCGFGAWVFVLDFPKNMQIAAWGFQGFGVGKHGNERMNTVSQRDTCQSHKTLSQFKSIQEDFWSWELTGLFFAYRVWACLDWTKGSQQWRIEDDHVMPRCHRDGGQWRTFWPGWMRGAPSDRRPSTGIPKPSIRASWRYFLGDN